LTVQRTLVPNYVIELQRIDKKLSKLERRVLFLSAELNALEHEIKRLGGGVE